MSKRPPESDTLPSSKRQKLLHSSSASGPFSTRRTAAELERGDVQDGVGFVEGTIHMVLPRLRQIRICLLDAGAGSTPKFLQVEFANALLRRLPDWSAGDQLRLAMKGGEVEVLQKAPAQHVIPIKMGYSHEITVHVVRKSSPAGTDKLFEIRLNTRSTEPHTSAPQKKKQDVDDWFSTPPTDSESDAATAGTHVGSSSRATTVARSSPIIESPHPSASKTLHSPATHTQPVSKFPAEQSAPRPEAIAGPSSFRAPRNGPFPASSSRLAAFSNASVSSSATARPNAPRSAPSPQIPPPTQPLAFEHQSSNAAMTSLSGGSVAGTSVNSAAPITPDTGDPRRLKVTRREKRKQAKLAKKEHAHENPQLDSVTSEHDQRAQAEMSVECVDIGDVYSGKHLPEDSQSKLTTFESKKKNGPLSVPTATSTVKDDLHDENSVLPMAVWLRALDGTAYTPLANLADRKMSFILAVVTSCREITTTQTGDLSQCITVLDPSNLDKYGGILCPEGAGIKVNMFTKKYERWLPSPQSGDVIILREVKVQDYQGNTSCTAYGNRARWAMYDSKARVISHGDLADVPRSERLGKYGDGILFSPFWNPSDKEVEYCKMLSEWWQAVMKARNARKGDVVQIGDDAGSAPNSAAKPKRTHCLIRDVQLGSYFDCTVEILHGHGNINVPDIYSIYVTDFTKKNGAGTVNANWCSPGIADRVLRVEMWREARELGPKMKPGEVWSLKNVRLKLSPSGYVEGAFSEAWKASKLSLDQADRNPFLQGLLERKKDWEKDNVNQNEFPHKLFEEVDLLSFFDCTVELLHLKHSAAGSTIFVTDYTERTDLAFPPSDPWVGDLAPFIVTIELRDAQSKMAQTMAAGSLYSIRHLRLLRNSTGIGNGRVIGQLKGPDRLIHQANLKTPNERVAALLKRKEDIKQKKSNALQIARVTSGTPMRRGFSSIEQILNSPKCPGRFRVNARVTDFYPLRLRDCVSFRCRVCREEITDESRGCLKCKDTRGEYAFMLLFALKDDHSDAEIRALVDERFTDLAGLSPAELFADPSLEETLTERLGPYIGNISQYHEAFDTDEKVDVKTDLRDLTIVSWVIDDSGERAYALG
ncbi:hypothetical protein BV25DRAFT_1914244 [Artomyces pyxidatus]|uniref:Uncharacterized protein n=1 Tax=Artomyces pyxidatus TaxID=48021 RepID=A0ACB8T964_9AGAM|nr:hypothetical protein BV25DRAFT_1914244 [Artomyces pyxidatus]